MATADIKWVVNQFSWWGRLIRWYFSFPLAHLQTLYVIIDYLFNFFLKSFFVVSKNIIWDSHGIARVFSSSLGISRVLLQKWLIITNNNINWRRLTIDEAPIGRAWTRQKIIDKFADVFQHSIRRYGDFTHQGSCSNEIILRVTETI